MSLYVCPHPQCVNGWLVDDGRPDSEGPCPVCATTKPQEWQNNSPLRSDLPPSPHDDDPGPPPDIDGWMVGAVFSLGVAIMLVIAWWFWHPR